ncbi:hypothetical protein HYDPIDRAFT_118512 [Hydnomerulius pinastri MD-312]|uniref:Uncharacterized protein n=1 Tax=Hydnomerulius pinastri MD-312 TaxID=994086 RepID=A0A0C9W0L3_9AGAM|nr:hypothetical protein HYDPIDRAFT_118512 [Hydnomerulius pinastri MD-312]
MSTLYVIARYLGIALALNFWAFNANISMSPATCVAVDEFENWGAFVFTIIGEAIMSLRIYAMYMRSKIILAILVTCILGRIGVGIAVAVVIFGPDSGINATEWILSGIHVCGPSVNTASPLPLAWDITGVTINFLLFFLAIGRFIKHALEMRRMLHRWKVNDLMKVLVKDSIIYFFLNLVATIILMISVWGRPNDGTYFALITAYTQNEASVLIPRLVISFRENYSQDEQLGVNSAKGAIRSEKMEFKARGTDDHEMQSTVADRAQLSSVPLEEEIR